MSIDNQIRLGYAKPRRELSIYIMSNGMRACTIGLKPTQKWHILGYDNKACDEGLWTLKRKNIVINMGTEKFIKYFYRTER